MPVPSASDYGTNPGRRNSCTQLSRSHSLDQAVRPKVEQEKINLYPSPVSNGNDRSRCLSSNTLSTSYPLINKSTSSHHLENGKGDRQLSEIEKPSALLHSFSRLKSGVLSSIRRIPASNYPKYYSIVTKKEMCVNTSLPMLTKYHNIGDDIAENVKKKSSSNGSLIGDSKGSAVSNGRVANGTARKTHSVDYTRSSISHTTCSRHDHGNHSSSYSFAGSSHSGGSPHSQKNGSGRSDGRELSRRSYDGLEKRFPVGLHNLGNTCFMNSVLQCLSHTRQLLEYCMSDTYLREINTTTSTMKGALMKTFAKLLQNMWSGNESIVSPLAFKNQIQRFSPRFTGYNQQDAQEFLRYLLLGLHEDVNLVLQRPQSYLTDIDDCLTESQKASESWKRYLSFDNSKIVDIFVGQLKSTLCCTTCGHRSVTFDPFWDLSLPIPKTSGRATLSQCLNLFMEEEILEGADRPMCFKCKARRKCSKSFKIHKFPKILVLHLKRFSPHEKFRSKLNTLVDFPINTLDMSRYTSSNGSGVTAYNLYAVSNHFGTLFSGHYSAYCRHPSSNKWHEFNDSRVNPVSSSAVVTPEAYILFYELLPGQSSSRL